MVALESEKFFVEFTAWEERWRAEHPQEICPDAEKLLYEFSAERALLESGYRGGRKVWPLLYRAVRWLAGHCDGAVVLDFQGFNKRDTRMGRRLASCRWWTPKMAAEIHSRIGKYWDQLELAGIDYDAIPKPEWVE